MGNRPRKTITLIELGILVVIFAILRSVVVPVFSQAADSARDTTLRVELQRLQGAVNLYRRQHAGQLPHRDRFIAQLTMRTDKLGRVACDVSAGDAHLLGPYIERIPRNPYVNRRVADRVEIGLAGPGGGNAGWYFNEKTGVVSPDDDFYHDE